jgi:hypothetical protein
MRIRSQHFRSMWIRIHEGSPTYRKSHQPSKNIKHLKKEILFFFFFDESFFALMDPDPDAADQNQSRNHVDPDAKNSTCQMCCLNFD